MFELTRRYVELAADQIIPAEVGIVPKQETDQFPLFHTNKVDREL